MSPEFTFIVNPASAHGKGAEIGLKLTAELDRRGVQYEIVQTSRPGEGMELARQARGEVVVSVGGDGTLNEVLNGIIGSRKRLGVIPAGSGNDFVKSVGISSDPLQALENLLSRNTLNIDAGIVYIGQPPRNSRRYFCNGLGIGFDAEVAARTADVKRFSGIGVYMVAVLRTLGSYDAPEFRIRVEDRDLSGRKLLVAIGNGPCAGGGFYLTPRARVTDGLLDVCAIDAMGTISILRLMPRVMRGKHLTLTAVRYAQGRTIELAADRPFSVHADGEMIGRGMQEPVRIEVVPGAVELVGAGG